MSDDFQNEMLKALISFGTLVIKTLVLVNGAAIIALLTFFGNVWDKQGSAAIVAAGGASLKSFVIGLIAAVSTAAASYMSQLFFAELPLGHPHRRWSAELFRGLAIVLAVASLGFFSSGALQAQKAMLIPPPATAQTK